MGTCASNKRQMVVRQSSTIKKFGTTAIHATDLKNNVAMIHTQLVNSNNTVKQYNPQQHERDNSVKLLKHDSGLNLLPAELQLNMTALSDETIFEREKRMVVLLVSSQHDKPSQLAVLDVDCQSPGFGKVIRRMDLPLPGEELYSLGCMRNTHSNLHDLEHLTEKYSQFTLVAPVPSHSRIYVFTLMEGSSSGSSNGSLLKRTANADVNGANNGKLIKLRIQKCITREELSRWDLGVFKHKFLPFYSKINNAVPLLVVTTVDRYGHCKGDLIRLDRRTYCPVDRRRRSNTGDDKTSSTNSPSTSVSSSPTLLSRSTLTTGISATISATTRFPHFGGALAIHLRHLLAFTTEWGDLDQILCHSPNLKAPKLGSQEMLDNPNLPEDPIYGNKVNVWDMRKRTLFQKIKLEPPADGRWPICIRMVHQAELTHGFVCTALGSSMTSSSNSPSTSVSSSPTLLSRSTLTTGISATISATTRFPHFGGALAIHLRHLLAFTTEWGDLDQILCHSPNLKAPKLGSQEVLDNPNLPEDPIYGNKVNVWDMRKRTLFQKIKLEPPADGRWPICIRMVHQAELTHGYHLHKSTKTGMFSADRVIKFSAVAVGDWPGEVPEVPAFLTDMVISMDDQHLYVCAAFHGFVAQLNISDPFRPSLTQKVFLGGIVCRTMGILHGSKTPMGKDSALRVYIFLEF
uniref:Telo_bind domain-containing protein n=1 Tax=Globodera pallida TaxID=36090 RepID=A0A183BZL0_GLOPA